jgi:FkbM family methyltransferase
MNPTFSKLLRTAQVNFPSLLEAKFAVMRRVRSALRVPFETDFRALALFPDTAGAEYLDVGANRGQSTDAILLTRQNVRIHQFEPNPLLVDKLTESFGKDRRVVIHSFGLGDATTDSVLFVPFYKRWMFDGLGSLHREEAATWLRDNIFLFNRKAVTFHEWRCQIRRLDDLGLAPFFIKLDVQGHEYHALRGGEGTIRAHEPVLLVEWPDDRTFRMLKEIGYEFFAFENGRFVRGLVGRPNTFFMTAKTRQLVRDHITEPAR